MSDERRPMMLLGAAAAMYVFSLVEVAPTFVAPSAAAELTRSPSLRGASSFQGSEATPVFSRAGCQVASTFLALSACALAARTRASKKTRTQLCATVGSGVNTYSKALADAAMKVEEIRAVTKDVMKVKELLRNDAFREKLQLMMAEPYLSDTDKGKELCKLWAPLESTVFPKFVTFIAKKKRLAMMSCKDGVFDQYMLDQYRTQKIMPVRVQSAKRLTEAQKEKIITKMIAKTGASDIKLVLEVLPALKAGLTIEWAFTDPDVMTSPTEGLDLSLKSVVKKAATKEGVPVQIL
jgi:ATP synthase F1 delta subunit